MYFIAIFCSFLYKLITETQNFIFFREDFISNQKYYFFFFFLHEEVGGGRLMLEAHVGKTDIQYLSNFLWLLSE